MKAMTPEEYLSRHEINGLLRELGVTDEQKNSARLVPQDGVKFESWPVTSMANWPNNTANAKRAWCALKWLVLDDPKCSEDTEKADKYVSDFLERKKSEKVSAELEKVSTSKELVAGKKHYASANKAGENARKEKLKRAVEYCKVIRTMKDKNKKLTKEAAVKAAFADTAVKRTAGLSYIKLAFLDWDQMESK